MDDLERVDHGVSRYALDGQISCPQPKPSNSPNAKFDLPGDFQGSAAPSAHDRQSSHRAKLCMPAVVINSGLKAGAL